MKTNSAKVLPAQRLRTCAIVGVKALAGSGSAFAQVSQETLKSISILDKAETPIGELEFFDGGVYRPKSDL